MNASILISFYLLKDIWKRWFEAPGGVLSRVIVALILGLLLLVIDAAFTLTAASIQKKISEMGVKTIILSRSVAQPFMKDSTRLFRLLTPLDSEGDLLRLQQAGVAAVDEFGNRILVRGYGAEMLRPLTPFLQKAEKNGVLLITDTLPEGMRSKVVLMGETEVLATVIVAPRWMDKFGNGGSVLLLPATYYPDIFENGYYEFIVFLGNETADLTAIENQIGLLFSMEKLGNVQITSPRILLEELDQLEALQSRWQSGFGLIGGVAVALVFGSIAILEYRQNRYITALLKSFGAPITLVVTRYLFEALLLTIIAAFLAWFVAGKLYAPIFEIIGVDAALLSSGLLQLGNLADTWTQLRWLGLGAILSVVPIAFAVRTPVGKILA